MKKMTCKQLGGACDLEFTAETFAEMKELSKNHGMEMFQKGDKAHLKAMMEMKNKMQDPKDMQAWLAEKEALFNQL